MQFLVLVTILTVTVVEFLTAERVLPAPLAFLPELLTAIVSFCVVVFGVRTRFDHVRAQYWLVFGAILIVVLCGLLANSVGTGPTIAGARRYLRAIPFFFLPAVVCFTESQIRTQVRLLLIVCLIQLPLAVAQRLTLLHTGHWSGDAVTGTLLISSIMSMFLICGVCVLTGMLLQKRISKGMYFVLFLLLLIPTTINETKATLILLPIGLLAAFLNGSRPGRRLQIVLSAALLLSVFGSIYIPVYDYFNTVNNPYPSTISEFFTSKEALQRYLDANADVGSRKGAGRVDALIVPLSELSQRDPTQLALGVGMGNASRSALGSQFTGAYSRLYGAFADVSSSSQFLIEIGLIGTSLVFLLYWLIFRDACAVARSDPSIRGAIAIGLAGATPVLAIAMFYKGIHAFDSLAYMFWYFSGLVAARRTELAAVARRAESRTRTHTSRAPAATSMTNV